MYVCLDCGHTFSDPEHYIDTHGLDSPPYESWNGCPYCGGAYRETYLCDCCGNWIDTDTYVEIGDERYCENCFTICKLEEI